MRPGFSALLAVLMFAGACGSDAADPDFPAEERQALIDDLVDNRGVALDDATCAIDGQIAEFGDRILDPDDTPTEAEVDRLVEIWEACGLLAG